MAQGKNTSRHGAGQLKIRKLSETEKWVCGLLLMAVSLVLFISLASYLSTWDDDQAVLQEKVRWDSTERMDNQGGNFGAVLGSFFVSRLFGVFALCIPIALAIIAIRIMRTKPLFLHRAGRITIIAMILGSLTLGFLFGTRWGVFGTGLGGQAGIAAAAWLKAAIGNAGLAVVVLTGWILLAVYINRSTIKVVNRVGASVARGTVDLIGKIPHQRHDTAGTAAEAAAMETDNPYYSPEEQPSAATPSSAGSNDAVPESLPADSMPHTGHNHPDIFITEPEPEETAENRSPRETVPDNSPFSVYTPEEPAAVDDAPAKDDEDLNDDEIIISDDTPLPKQPPIRPVRPAPATDTQPSDDFMVVDENGNRIAASSLRENERPAVTLGAGGVVVSDTEGIEVVKTDYSDTEADEEAAAFRDPTRTLPRYQRPSWAILKDHSIGIRISEEEIRINKNIIKEKLEDFGIKITDRIKATIGPTVTLYEIEPAQGVKVSRIRNLEEDIALALKVQTIRIVTLGQGHGTVGIEVPNSTREIVSMLSVVKSVKFQECKYRLPIALGKTIYNEIYIGDLTKMPHLLVAGATGQGKSVGLNAIIASLLYKKHPAELKFVFIDPKQVELSSYAKLEHHFLAKMEGEENAIITDTYKAVNTLNSLVMVMEERYTLLNRAGERNIADYNARIQEGKLKKRDGHGFMPYIVVVIDEFADMIMTVGREIEIPITRLAAKARAIGIHLIVATQRPDVKVITGLIKSNIPARIAFKVVSMVDSRTIIDQPGANNLIGMGDMLLYLNGELTRMQCAFLDTPEIDNLTSFIAQQEGYDEPYLLPYVEQKSGNGNGGNGSEETSGEENMFVQVARFVVQNRQGSTSAIQRNFRLGYNRAGRMMDKLEKMGIVGRQDGSKPREVLVDAHELELRLLDYTDEELESI